MVNGIVITNAGSEHSAFQEVSEYLSAGQILEKETVVTFSCDSISEIYKLAYLSQSAYRVLVLLGEFPIHLDLEKTSDGMNVPEEIIKKVISSKGFDVQCERHGEHDFRSVDLAQEYGRKIVSEVKKTGSVPVVDFNSPDLVIYLYVHEDKGYLCIDVSGTELAKRQYKIFNHPESLKATTAFNLLKVSGFTRGKVLVDPFMGSGVIPIEAALYVNKIPVRFYDKDTLLFTRFEGFEDEKFFQPIDVKKSEEKTKIFGYDLQLRFLKATKKNAKLAGVDKVLNMGKSDVEWLDTKFDEKSVDLIVTDPPRLSKNRNRKQIEKIYDELFYQSNYVLKKDGKVALLVHEIQPFTEAAEKHKFKLSEKHLVSQGKEIFYILIFTRG